MIVEAQNDLTGLAGWISDVIDGMGALGVGLLIALENLFPPLPSELVLPLAGFTAGQGRVGLIAVIIAATAGSLAGALLLYGLGAALGHERACRWADRIPLIDPAEIQRATDWFCRHGGKAVLFGRLVPVFRSFISIPAGIERMPLKSFCLYTLTGSAVWNTVFVLAGFTLGEQWQQAERFSSWLTWAFLGMVGVAVAKFAISRWKAVRSTT